MLGFQALLDGVFVETVELLIDGAWFFVADPVAFNAADGHEFHDGVGEEDFGGIEEVLDDQGTLFVVDVVFFGEIEGESASDAGQDGGV